MTKKYSWTVYEKNTKERTEYAVGCFDHEPTQAEIASCEAHAQCKSCVDHRSRYVKRIEYFVDGNGKRIS